MLPIHHDGAYINNDKKWLKSEIKSADFNDTLIIRATFSKFLNEDMEFVEHLLIYRLFDFS